MYKDPQGAGTEPTTMAPVRVRYRELNLLDLGPFYLSTVLQGQYEKM